MWLIAEIELVLSYTKDPSASSKGLGERITTPDSILSSFFVRQLLYLPNEDSNGMPR